MSIPSDPLPDTSAARARVAPPAWCLIVLSGLGLLSHLASLGRNATVERVVVVNADDEEDAQEFIERNLSGPQGAGLNVVALLVSGVMLYGGWQMKNLEQWGFALAAAILAAIPCMSPCCCLSTPVGIWALVVLNNPAIKSSFRS